MAQLRALADDGDWPAFIAALSADHSDRLKRIGRTRLRTALLQSGQDATDAIAGALTPEAILGLGLPMHEVRGFAEALMQSRDLDWLLTLLTATAKIAPDDPAVAGLQICMLGRLKKTGAIRQVLRERPGAFHDIEALLYASDHVRLKNTEHERLADYIEDLPGDSSSALRLRGIRWLYRVGEVDRAEMIARRYHGNAEVSDFDSILNILTNAPRRAPRLVESAVSPEVGIGHSEGDRAALIFFGGFVTPGGGGGQGGIMDRYIGDLGLTLISVNDPTHLLCLKGIPGIADTIAESAEALRRLVADMGLEKIYTMGGSAGGFPAVVYGLHLEAEAALLFGSPTDCGPGNSHIDFRSQVVARKLQRNFDNATLDMVSWLDRFDYALPITLYYSAGNKIDAWHAQRVADRPHVRTVVLEGEASHQVMIEAARGQTLGEVFSSGLSLPPKEKREAAMR